MKRFFKAAFSWIKAASNLADRALQRAEYNLAVLFSPFAGGMGIINEIGQAGPLSDGQILHRDATVPGAIYGVPAAGPVTQPTQPSQAVASFALGQSAIVVYTTVLSPAAVNANTCVEQALTVTGIQAGSLVFVNKPATQAGLGIASSRVSAANTIQVTFFNVTAGNITPTATQNYSIVEIRPPLIQSVALSPAIVATLTTAEQVFSITPAANAAGLSGNQVGLTSGVTALNQNPPASSALAAGVEPSSLNRTRVTVGNPQTVIVNKPTSQAGLGVVNARISANNELALTFLNTSGAGITPTAAETYLFFASRGLALTSPYVTYLVHVGTLAQTNTITTAEQTVTVNGLAAGDKIVGVSKPTAQAGLGICGWRVTAANTLGITFNNPTAAGITPTANEIYTVTVQKAEVSEGAVLTQFTVAIVPAAVATITGAEQTFTVTGLAALSPVMVNAASGVNFTGTDLGGAMTQGIAIGGFRTSALNTLAINFCNVTAAAITPVPMILTVLAAQPDQSGAAAGALGSAVVWPVDVAAMRAQETLEAIRQALVVQGAMAGA